MSSIGRAAVPGTLTLDRAVTEPITAGTEQHPTWCIHRGDVGVNCAGTHMNESVVIPATGGEYVLTTNSAKFPYLDVDARTSANGARLVNLTVFSPFDRGNDWLGVDLLPAAARMLAVDLAALVAGEREATRGRGNDGAVWVAVAAGRAGLIVIDRRKVRQLSATLRVDELARVADALTGAAEVAVSA